MGERCGLDMSALPAPSHPQPGSLLDIAPGVSARGSQCALSLGLPWVLRQQGCPTMTALRVSTHLQRVLLFPKTPHMAVGRILGLPCGGMKITTNITETPFVAWASTSKTLWSFHQVGVEPRPTEPPSLSQCEPHMAPIVAASDSRWV